MYLRIWWKEDKVEKIGIIIGPSGQGGVLTVRDTYGNIVLVKHSDISKSEWVTDPTAGVSTKPPRGSK